MIVGSVAATAAARIALSWTGGGLEDDWPGILVAVVAVLDATSDRSDRRDEGIN